MTRAKILLVDDDSTMVDFIAKALRKYSYDTKCITQPEEAFQAVLAEDFDVVVTDIQMPKTTGIELCRQVLEHRPYVPVVVMTAFGSMESAVAAIRAGAYDFIAKPFEAEGLGLVLERAVKHKALKDEIQRLKNANSLPKPHSIVGESAPIQKIFELLSRIQSSESTVLIRGETGTGKELVARALHEQSERKGRPFVAVNCAAVPETLLESELFGHAAGAFTDAKTGRRGLFAEADGGTLFLDEVGDLPLAVQPKLLRVLQDQRVRPIGSSEEVTCDVRLIAATHRDLDGAVEEKSFREDLYFRLNVISIELPPLRARGTDVLLLAQHFVDELRRKTGKNVLGIAAPTAEKLLAYPWPGNVRELSNCIERAVALTAHEELLVDDLPERIRNYKRSHVVVASNDPSELVPLADLEARYIARVLEEVGHNKTLAARVLGIERKTLYRKLEKLGKHASV